jgi:HPr kinase/phosphorylase
MTISDSIHDLIRTHQQELTLSWLSHPQPLALPSSAAMHYWLGEYSPEQYHPIELIQRDNLKLLKSALQQDIFYLPEAIASAQPELVIFCDDISCDRETQAGLQYHGIAVLQSPLSAKLIARTLSHALAEGSPNQTVHGVMLAVYDEGVLLTGNSGLGKSAIALDLIARGHQLVADDAPLLHQIPGNPLLYAVCPPLLADFLEVRALGILNICKLFGPAASTACMPVDLVIELVEDFYVAAEQRLQPYTGRTNILGMDIPHLQIPIEHATNLALMVETVTKNHILYKEGYDASAVLTARQQQLLNKQTV